MRDVTLDGTGLTDGSFSGIRDSKVTHAHQVGMSPGMEAAMNVKTILAAKGGDIFSIEPTADLAAAAKLLSTHRIGAAIICGAGGRLAGILSERDIVRALVGARRRGA